MCIKLATPHSPPQREDRLIQTGCTDTVRKLDRAFFQEIRECGCDHVVEIDTDHTPQLSQAKKLAEAMQQFAGLTVTL